MLAIVTECTGLAAFTGNRVPDFGLQACDTKAEITGFRAVGAVDNKIDLRISVGTMDVIENFRLRGLPIEGKVGLDAIGQQDFPRGFAPDDVSLAVDTLCSGFAVEVAPYFSCKGSHLLISIRPVFQSGRQFRRRPCHGCPVADEIADLADHLNRHAVRRDFGNGEPLVVAYPRADLLRGGGAVLQHQQAIAHPVGQYDPPVLHGHSGEQHFGIAVVAIVTGTQRGIDVFRRSQCR